MDTNQSKPLELWKSDGMKTKEWHHRMRALMIFCDVYFLLRSNWHLSRICREENNSVKVTVNDLDVVKHRSRDCGNDACGDLYEFRRIYSDDAAIAPKTTFCAYQFIFNRNNRWTFVASQHWLFKKRVLLFIEYVSIHRKFAARQEERGNTVNCIGIHLQFVSNVAYLIIQKYRFHACVFAFVYMFRLRWARVGFRYAEGCG